jgi:hypothetical protein
MSFWMSMTTSALLLCIVDPFSAPIAKPDPGLWDEVGEDARDDRKHDDYAEHEVEYVDIMKQHIEFCTGCFACKKNGGNCIHDDDMAALLQKYLNADVTIFSFPLYCYGIPAPLKAFFDRTMPLSTMAMQKVGDRYEHTGPVDFSRIHTVVISGCGFPSATNNYEPLRREFELMIPHDLFMLTVPEAPMFNAPEAAVVTAPFLELVREAGRQYAESFNVSVKLMEKLAVPMIPEEMYTVIANGGKA